ncbi:unnamed protein product [Allacma fusca]|uniref:XK-related protein n=1 Tax=Allacma fusca TaxID=39272 RepID=A0A8J2KA20_9HEXA|nr:unnamed protein product [Allacma fusca]
MGIFLQFFWHLCMITSRVFALAIFASAYPTIIIPVCLVHWVIMFIWLRDEPTRGKYWFFYLVCFVENTVMMFSSVWLPQHMEFSYFVISSYGLFFIGILLMWIYYRWFHPTGRFTSTYNAIKYMAFISRGSRAMVSNDYD